MAGGLATLFEIAAHNALSRRPPAGRPWPPSDVSAVVPVLLVHKYLKDPAGYIADLERDRRFEERLRDRGATPPPALPLRAHPVSYIILGGY